MTEKMMIDRGCFERGCACVDKDPDAVWVKKKRKWRKLTIEEIVNLAKLHLYVIYGSNASCVGGEQEFAKAINDKLKDKNK